MSIKQLVRCEIFLVEQVSINITLMNAEYEATTLYNISLLLVHQNANQLWHVLNFINQVS